MSTVDTAVHLTVEEASHELYSVVTEVNVVHLVFTLLAVFILVFGMISALVKEKLYAGEAIVATAFGIIFGPHCADLMNPRAWGNPSFDDITLEFTRIVLALSVFAVGVELPRAYVKRHWRSLLMVLGPLMVAGWLITGGLIYALVPKLSFLGALVVAACATPTDPILAASVVGKGKFAQKHVPSHIRHLLQCESGCNDGAAFPFLYLALFLLFREGRSVGHAIGMWIVLVILYQITLGIIIGSVTGIVARKLLKFSKRRGFIDRESMVAMYVSLAIFTTAVTTLAGSDDLLAAFACGAAFAWDDWFSESIEDSNFSNIIDLLVNCATFIYIGATMPFQDFENAELTLKAWKLAVLGISVLLVRRLPMMLLLYKWIPDIKTFREAVFAGHFGPMGVGAIFIATLALTKLPTPHVPPETSDDILALTIQPIVYFLVLCSIVVHGSSVPFFNMGKRVHTISRTWTNRSETNEPSWLSRVKRVGDVNGNGNGNSNGNDEKDEKAAARRRQEADIEAGDHIIDDPGMDTGDFSAQDFASRDYATGVRKGSNDTRQGSGSSKDKTSPTASSDKTMADSKNAYAEGNEDAAFKQRDNRLERHDSGPNDEEEVWQEGDDVVIDRHHGDDVSVQHQGHHQDQQTHHGERDGPGFPGHRFEEIQRMLEGGEHTEEPEETDESESPASSDVARPTSAQGSFGKRKGKGQDIGPHIDEDTDGSDTGSLMREASRRVAGKQVAEEQRRGRKAAPTEVEETQDEEEGRDTVAPLYKAQVEANASSSAKGNSQETSPQRPDIKQAAGGKSWMSAQGLASMTGLVRPQPKRRTSLTPEEKYARDAWCRKERKDVDDDQVKTWISGRHMVLERNNGEDVEIVDINPSKEAREKAKKSDDVNLRELPLDQVKAAKQQIKSERQMEGSSGASTEAEGSHKRFDLKKLRGKESFMKFLGGDGAARHESSRREPVEETAPGPSMRIARDVPTITESGPEEDQPTILTGPDSSEGNGARLKWADPPSLLRSTSRQASADDADRNTGDRLAALSSGRRTGIPMERTETTDSQVRFAKLPTPSRK